MNKCILIVLLLIYFGVVLSITGSPRKRRVRRNLDDEDEEIVNHAIIKLSNYLHCFYGPITVGTAREGEKNQEFTVMFDTGSKHLWLFSEEACPGGYCANHSSVPFIGSKSDTYRNVPGTFEITYLDTLSVHGNLAKDILKFGKGKTAIKMKDQTFGLAINFPKRYENGAYKDGILGLSLSDVNYFPGKPDPPFWSMFKQHDIVPMFGLYLNKTRHPIYAGELYFGGYDEDRVDGSFTSHAVNTIDGKYYGWKITLNKVTISNCDEVIHDGDIPALVDSGTNTIVGPEKMIAKLNKQLIEKVSFGVNDDFQFFCNTPWDEELPDVIFTMKGIDYVMKARDYVWIFEDMPELCSSGFYGDKIDYVILGQPFMIKYYTKYDVGNRRVDFALAKHDDDQPTQDDYLLEWNEEEDQ